MGLCRHVDTLASRTGWRPTGMLEAPRVSSPQPLVRAGAVVGGHGVAVALVAVRSGPAHAHATAVYGCSCIEIFKDNPQERTIHLKAQAIGQ